MISIGTLHTTGRTLRYHANPTVSGYAQTVADHTWGVLAILYRFHPAPSRALLGATMFHDSAELWAGDLPGPFKREHGLAARAHEKAEQQIALEKGIPQFSLTAEETRWLKFADRLECYLYVRIKCPWLLENEGWQKLMVDLVTEAEALGIVEDIFA